METNSGALREADLSSFADRLPSENWMIIDDIRRLAIVHPADRDYYLTPLTPEELRRLSREPDDQFVGLWKEFFVSTAILQRKNYRCQRTMLPLWYRKNMTEFRETGIDLSL